MKEFSWRKKYVIVKEDKFWSSQTLQITKILRDSIVGSNNFY